ncbi:MAG: SurA N-terminal domain-containing protein, partial [Fervidobacterium sp.]
MKKLFRNGFVVLFLLFSLHLLAQENVVAVVNGRNITLEEWNREANINKLLLDIQNSNDNFYQVLTSSQEGLILLEKYRLKVLDTLIRKVSFIQFAESLGLAASDEDTRKDVDNEIKKMLEDLKMTEQQLNEYLLKLGMGALQEYRLRLYFQRKY